MTLYELNNLVRRSIETLMTDEYWVEAELAEVRESHGHCYMELVENDERSATPIARASAKCWRQTWAVVRPYFERSTGQPLHSGMKVMLRVYPQFHEAYGFSWIVSDIDPTYTLGDMARRRIVIVRQLKEEGVFDLNKQLSLPMFTQRIAVVSSETAAGYGDFCAQLTDNDYGFSFTVTLFPATMQGEQVETSVICALNAINERCEEFDCVVIIRGGGATSDMSGFDTLTLAENVANFPLPIITGIGHERDESVLDMVSHTRVKTPTAAAAFLIGNLKAVADRLDNAAARLPVLFSMVSAQQTNCLQLLTTRLTSATKRRCVVEQSRLEALSVRLHPSVVVCLQRLRHRLELLEQRTAALDPQQLLRRGYSITMYKGKAVRDASQVVQGEEIETRVERGTIKSIIK